jgi:hypothetical protein
MKYRVGVAGKGCHYLTRAGKRTPDAGQLTFCDAIHFFGPKRPEIGLNSPLINRWKLICLSGGGSTPKTPGITIGRVAIAPAT